MKCCICGKEIEGYSNNPAPLRNEQGKVLEGYQNRCCGQCNSKYVVNFRLSIATGHNDEAMEIQEAVLKLRKAAGIATKKRYAVCTVERNDGSTYEQQCEIVNGSLSDTMHSLQQMLGKGYYVCSARIEED